MVNPITLNVAVDVCNDAAEAIARGHDYSAPDCPVKPIEVERLVIVRKGTTSGQPTVDFVLRAEDGQRYTFIITGALLRSLPC